MRIAKEGLPFILASALIGTVLLFLSWIPALLSWIGTAYFVYFFRDPERRISLDPSAIVSGADGRIAAVRTIPENEISGIEEIRKETGEAKPFHGEALRISVFLSLFDVHVNRAPMAGRVRSVKYYPGKRYFTFIEKSSLYNQHNAIVIGGSKTRCLIHQIVGPVARRVVAWLTPGQEIASGDRIGIMKFGSRLDMYFPKADLTVRVKPGDRVVAGETIVAALK